MSGFTKLFSSIVTSPVWNEAHTTRIVWITMLAMSNSAGIVEGSIPGFAVFARVTHDEMLLAVERLCAPDPHSRIPDHEGRRIEAIEGGWRILNYRAYRDRGQGKDGSRAPAMRAYRARRRQNALPDTVTDSHALQTDVTRDTEDRRQKAERTREESTSPSAPAHTAEDLQQLWNTSTSLPIPRCRELTMTRRRHAEARLRERGLDGMRGVFAAINATPFCRGENERGWTATFDWALTPAAIVKVLEGAYAGGSNSRRHDAKANATGRTGAPSPGKYDHLDGRSGEAHRNVG